MKYLYIKIPLLPISDLCSIMKSKREGGQGLMQITKSYNIDTVTQYCLHYSWDYDIQPLLDNGIEIGNVRHTVYIEPLQIPRFKDINNKINIINKMNEISINNEIVAQSINNVNNNKDVTTEIIEVILPTLPHTIQNKIIEYCFSTIDDPLKVRSGILGWYSDYKLELNLVCWRYFHYLSTSIFTRINNDRIHKFDKPHNFFTHLISPYCVFKRVTHLKTSNIHFAFNEHHIGQGNDRTLAEQVYQDSVLATLEVLVMNYGSECTNKNPYELECILFKAKNIRHFAETNNNGYGCGILQLLTSIDKMETLNLLPSSSTYLISYIGKIIAYNIETLRYAKFPITTENHANLLEMKQFIQLDIIQLHLKESESWRSPSTPSVPTGFPEILTSETSPLSTLTTPVHPILSNLSIKYKILYDGIAVDEETLVTMIEADKNDNFFIKNSWDAIVVFKRDPVNANSITITLKYRSCFYKSMKIHKFEDGNNYRVNKYF